MARTQGHGNPNWTRDETILALDLLFDCNGTVPSRNDARLVELSEVLRQLPYHEKVAQKATFRNAEGVRFKLHNLQSVADGREQGLQHVSAMDRAVWTEFAGAADTVKQLAYDIRQGVFLLRTLGDYDLDEEEFFEGRVIMELHRRKERSRKVRIKLLANRREKEKLLCDLCSVGSLSRDPRLEDAIFEAHHLVPLSTSGERKSRIADFALLCASCHRLLNRLISIERRWLDIATAKKILDRKQV
jgi:5-methylcytosine-specific restriction protein A